MIRLTIWLGPSWIVDYVLLLSQYNPDSIPAAFSPFVRIDSMSNLEHFLHQLTGLAVSRAALASNATWLAGAILVSWYFLRHDVRPPAFAVALGAMLYATLCSHLNFPYLDWAVCAGHCMV